MTLALLFNSDDPKFNGIYGDKIMQMVFESEILQESGRHLKISIGDVLIYSHSKSSEEYINLAERTYFVNTWEKLLSDKLRDTYLKQTVYAWVIQNATQQIGKNLHSHFSKESYYLGIHNIDFSYPVHLALYRNSMIPKYRVIGKKCYMFFTMSDEEAKDSFELDEIKSLGFDSVCWEDYGAKGTIFDDFDTLEHFKQIKEFREIISPFLDGIEDEADELIMLIEDLNTRLFNTLGAAVRALARAQNEEDYAHVGLSARRYFEQLADVVFPPRKELYNGRKVGNAEYRNRIWAFISDSIIQNLPNEGEKIEKLGKEADRLIEEANAALHSARDKKRIFTCFIDIAKLSILLLSLKNPNESDPYYAYKNKLEDFMKGLK